MILRFNLLSRKNKLVRKKFTCFQRIAILALYRVNQTEPISCVKQPLIVFIEN